MKNVFTIAFLFVLKQYYQIPYQLIKNPIAQIMSYRNWKKFRDNKNFIGTVLKDLFKPFD